MSNSTTSIRIAPTNRISSLVDSPPPAVVFSAAIVHQDNAPSAEPKPNPHLLSPSEVKAIWQQQTATPGVVPCLSSFFTRLDPDEVDLIDFIYTLKPEFRFGRRVDWEIVKKLFAQASGLGEPYAMQLIRELELKGLFARDGEMLYLVWQLKVGQFVLDGVTVDKPAKDKKREVITDGKTTVSGIPKPKHKSKQVKIANKSDRRCVYSGRKPMAGTIDHATPRSRGGGGGDNLVFSCQSCNAAKGDRTPEEWALSILQYRSRIANGRESRIVTTALKYRQTLPMLAHRITAAMVACLALVFLRNGGAR